MIVGIFFAVDAKVGKEVRLHASGRWPLSTKGNFHDAFVTAALIAVYCIQYGAAEIKCNNCSEAAYQSSALNSGVGIHYVYDLVKGASRKYEITRSCEYGNICTKEIDQYPVEADVDYVVAELAAYYTATSGQMGSWFTWHADGAVGNMSAFDVAAVSWTVVLPIDLETLFRPQLNS